MFQAFLKHKQSSNPSISVLKRMYTLKFYMEV